MEKNYLIQEKKKKHRINQSGTVETAGDQGQGEGADPVLPKAERGGQSREN